MAPGAGKKIPKYLGRVQNGHTAATTHAFLIVNCKGACFMLLTPCPLNFFRCESVQHQFLRTWHTCIITQQCISRTFMSPVGWMAALGTQPLYSENSFATICGDHVGNSFRAQTIACPSTHYWLAAARNCLLTCILL